MPTGVYSRKPLSDETKRKIGLANSIALKGRKLSEEHRKHVVSAMWGRKHPPRSEEWRMKQRKAKLGVKKGPPSEATKEKIRQALLKSGIRPPVYKGKDCHFWKGGITPINEAIRRSSEYKKWRKGCLVRDKFMCTIGGKDHGNKLQVDHIKPFALYPDFRFILTNGRTLCEECHRKTDTFGSKTNLCR